MGDEMLVASQVDDDGFAVLRSTTFKRTLPTLDHVGSENANEKTASFPFQAISSGETQAGVVITPNDQISDEVLQEINPLAEKWAVGLERRFKDADWLDRLLRVKGECCVSQMASRQKTDWTQDHAGQYACHTCTIRGRLCFTPHASKELWLLPLHPRLRADAAPGTLRYYADVDLKGSNDMEALFDKGDESNGAPKKARPVVETPDRELRCASEA
jgi:hypothetical protein